MPVVAATRAYATMFIFEDAVTEPAQDDFRTRNFEAERLRLERKKHPGAEWFSS